MDTSVEDMTINELLDELIDLAKQQFILGCGLFGGGADRDLYKERVGYIEQRIAYLRDEIRKRAEEKI